jgi:hypothetical protein
LIDGEGPFSIIVDRNKMRKLGWRVQLKFLRMSGLHTKDLNLLYLLKQYLGGIGSIHLAQNREIKSGMNTGRSLKINNHCYYQTPNKPIAG